MKEFTVHPRLRLEEPGLVFSNFTVSGMKELIAHPRWRREEPKGAGPVILQFYCNGHEGIHCPPKVEARRVGRSWA